MKYDFLLHERKEILGMYVFSVHEDGIENREQVSTRARTRGALLKIKFR